MQHALIFFKKRVSQPQSCLIFFFISKSAYVKEKSSICDLRKIQICFLIEKKNSDLYLRNMQIYFYVKKNSDLFFIEKKFRSTSKKNTDLFLF